MKTLAIIGAQWGDEGKGKITDLLGQKADIVIRFQGGNNAGHTIIIDDQKIVLHQIPSGVLHEHCISVIAHGVVFEPEAFLKELEEVQKRIAVGPERLKISFGASVITSYHKILDVLREGKSATKIGTTGKGIGPAYEDKVSRRGLKVKDLFCAKTIKSKLELALEEKEFLFKQFYKAQVPSLDQEVARLLDLGQKLAPYCCDTFNFIDQASREGKKLLFEGAQGVLLDIDYGSYPYVTSSSTSVAGVFTGAGLASGHIDERLGIAKAYITRVGEGPMPTEISEQVGDDIQRIGHEFGATTGRRRRCGWLDLPILKYAVKASSLTSIALTKVDVLGQVDELKVCYAYEVDGKEEKCASPSLDLTQARPLYKSFKVFKDDFKSEKYSEELQAFLDFIEKEIEIPIGILAFGPERSQIHFRKEYF